MRAIYRRLLCGSATIVVVALAACGPSAGDPASSEGPTAGSGGPPGGGTFGTQPCGKLVSFEEIAAATGSKPAIVDVVTPTQCNYEGQSGTGIVTIDRATDPSGQATCAATGGGDEPLTGLGDSAVWSAGTRTVCFVKGSSRVQITLGAQGADPKTTAVGLATKAVARLG